MSEASSTQLSIYGFENTASPRQAASQPAGQEAPPEVEPAVLAPMMRQYLEMKKQYEEYLLLFQVGDFYEVFYQDAKTVSSALNIRLTSRDKNNPDPVPMCGVPIHAIETYLSKLVKDGFSCVLVSQLDDERGRKGMVKREVTRIVTPGIRYEGDGLEAGQFNYLAAVLFGYQGGALTFVDVSTGKLRCQEFELLEDLLEAIERIRPAEIILPLSFDAVDQDKQDRWVRGCRKLAAAMNSRVVFRPFDSAQRAAMQSRLSRSLTAQEGIENLKGLGREALSTLQAVLDYVDEVSCGKPPKLAEFVLEHRARSVFIDVATRRNLELCETRIDGDRKNSLLGHIDYAQTAMGSRLLSDWILLPSCDQAEISSRHDFIDDLRSLPSLLSEIRLKLEHVRDIDRILSRVTSLRATPRDLDALGESLETLPELKSAVSRLDNKRAARLLEGFDTLDEVCARLCTAFVDEPPAKLTEGNIFRDGYHAGLDDLRLIRSEGHAMLAQLEKAERERTGISSLKVRYNNVFGYFIEVTKNHLQRVPENYERRQTLANAERFVTPQLKEFELKILSAKGKQIDLEKELFVELRSWVAEQAGRIQQTSRVLAELDVLCSFTYLALEHNYCRPVISGGSMLRVKDGRHSVVERVLGEQNFVPNDILLDAGGRRFAVLTGPNMGGKSTYLRQIGLIQLLAQAGSFVPASSAELSLVDRIFTRIGAADDLARGDSTFMVEMKEAAVIVKKATARSLVLIDEIGRGTATADGLAIATAVAEWLHHHVGCRTVFATHFHELSGLAEQQEGMFCLSVGVLEHDEQIEFTHRIEERAGDRSYGIEVAKLAGLPEGLLARAQALLQTESSLDLTKTQTAPQVVKISPVEEELRQVEPEQMKPIEALLFLEKLKRMLNGRRST